MSLLARFSLANRGLIALVAVVTTVFGAFAVPSLKQQLLPSLEFPAAFIVAPYPGAGPEAVESQVTEPIENSLQGIAGLEKVTSTSREGVATIQVEYEFGTDVDDAVNQMQAALNRIPGLPEGVDPQVIAGGTDDLPAVVLAASGGDDQRVLGEQLRGTVLPELAAIEGVRTVDLTGTRDEVLVITPDVEKLTAAGIQPTAFGGALRANGVAIPAGAVADGQQTLPVQVGTPLGTLDELRDVILKVAPAAPVRLGDVATVEEQLTPVTAITRTNGQDSLGIAVTATPDGNAVEISQEIRERLAELRAASGAELTVVFDQAPFVEKSIKGLATKGLIGLVMAALVILVFLLSVRSTVVTAVSIPLSVLVALIALWIGDYSLNLLTLGALTIAVGRVVDDSIVVLENIKRHLEYGESKQDAIRTAVREVAGAVTASTLTTVAVFAPIALVGGFIGQLFAPFAITVTVALLASLLVSLTLIPVLAYWFLQPAGQPADEAAVRRAAEQKELRNPLQRAYLPVIGFATRARSTRWITLGLGVLVLFGTFGLSRQLETNFLDDSGQDTMTITQELPAGTGLAGTDAAAQRVEEVLADTEGIETYQVTAGVGGNPWAGAGGNNVATWSLTLVDTDAEQMRAALREKFDEFGAEAGEFRFGAGQGGAAANQLEVIVQAIDSETRTQAIDEASAAMAGLPGVEDVTTSVATQVGQVAVKVDRTKAAAVGLTEATVGQLVAQAFRGAPLGQLTIEGQQRDVVLRTAPPPLSTEQLRALPVGAVTLGAIAEVSEVLGPQQITRIDGERSVSVTGTATGSDLGATSQELQERLDAIDVPGATFVIGGVSADQEEAFADLGLAVLAAIAIVFLIMVVTFRSLSQALILLVSVPFAATGAIGLLLATGTPLGVPALIGVLMLVGIVVTNAIVLLDLVNQYRAQGLGAREAVVEGGRRRLRPILMTAVATIFALLPMALGLTGEGGFISEPLAIVVIGGLLSSTLLTLVLVPTLYVMVEHAKESIRDWRAGRRGTPAVAETSVATSASAEPAASGPGAASPTATEPGAAEPAGRGATTATATGESSDQPTPSPALVEGTDQFEVLRLPRSRTSPLPPTEE
ncbi:efflux RND transporter permease subunit [Salinispora oceanensis]|uniref:efflux RND transporter permease subunit n=1 Tax=Salinispora oceanensis TaxID=1050199 RepID=UPI0003A856F8|nr:efflux RND transporter permease subunit [Salinispora oceanensis]